MHQVSNLYVINAQIWSGSGKVTQVSMVKICKKIMQRFGKYMRRCPVVKIYALFECLTGWNHMAMRKEPWTGKFALRTCCCSDESHRLRVFKVLNLEGSRFREEAFHIYQKWCKNLMVFLALQRSHFHFSALCFSIALLLGLILRSLKPGSLILINKTWQHLILLIGSNIFIEENIWHQVFQICEIGKGSWSSKK